MPLRDKALDMRNAIDIAELAMSGIENFERLADLFQDCRDDIEIKVPMTVGNLRQLQQGYSELNRIINSQEYAPNNLTE